MFDIIVCALTNLFRMYLINRFIVVFLGKLEKGRIREFLVYTCFYLVNTALFLQFHTAWINVLCNLVGIGIIVWLHTKSAKTIIFVTCSIYLIHAGCDVIGTQMFIKYKDGEVHSQVYAAVAVFLIFVCELITEKIITNRRRPEEAQNFPLIFVPLCSIAVICFLTCFNACSNTGMAIVSIGLLIVNFFMLYLYNILLYSISQKYETEMLKTQVQVYANQLEVILQGEERIKALRHDMKHHLNELMLLANKHDVPEIQGYIDQMGEAIQNPSEMIASGNMEIDSVLNYMLQRAREVLETVIVKVMLPEEVKHSFDINVLLGNLLENAIEAAKQTDKKYLNVNITLKKGVMKIKIENSFHVSNIIQKEQQGKGKVFLTTKPFKEQHGIGLKNVEKIVEKYNGTMELLPRDDLFCVNLILYMSITENRI